MASAQSEEKTTSEEKATATAKRYQEYDGHEVNIALLGKEESGKSNFLNGLQKFLPSKSGNSKLNMKEFPVKLPQLQASIKDCEEYDLFLFFTTSGELDKDELKVLEIIKSIDKKVFVVLSKMEEKTKIGDGYSKKGLRSSILKSVRTRIPEFGEEDIFLISNKYPDITEWDFEPLIRSILDALPLCIVRRLTPLAAPVFDCDDADKYANLKPLHELCNLFKKNIPAWSDAKVNIAIIGDAGTGKSSYINAIRGLDEDAEEAAEVGNYCGDTTKAPEHFSYPDNPNIRLWDIQGFGSTITKNDVDNYAKVTDLKKYDCLLIFFDTRLSENAVHLARKLQELKKPKAFFFVLTKADTIKNKKGSDKQAMLKKTREVLLKQFEKQHLGFISSQQLFLISNEEEHRNDYDFKKLTQAILDALPECKRGTLTLSLQACYQSILKKKFEILRGNVKWVAAKAAGYCAIPLPDALLGYVFDVDVVKKQAEEYKSQFGLDEEGKKYLDKYITGTEATVESNETAAKWSGALDLTGFWGGLSATMAAIKYGAKLVTKVGGAATFVLPMAAASYEGWSAQRTLHHCLDNLEKEAEEYLKKIVEKATSKVVKNE